LLIIAQATRTIGDLRRGLVLGDDIGLYDALVESGDRERVVRGKERWEKDSNDEDVDIVAEKNPSDDAKEKKTREESTSISPSLFDEQSTHVGQVELDVGAGIGAGVRHCLFFSTSWTLSFCFRLFFYWRLFD